MHNCLRTKHKLQQESKENKSLHFNVKTNVKNYFISHYISSNVLIKHAFFNYLSTRALVFILLRFNFVLYQLYQ